jgi:RES domain
VVWETTGWRLAAWDTPFWSGPNRRAGRYNRAGEDATQYICLHPWGPWAELLRWAGTRSPEQIADLRARVWSVRVTLPVPPRVLDFGTAAAQGGSADGLVSEDYGYCQQLGNVARSAGEPALITPSAALPGTSTLVLFGPRVLIPWQLEPIDLDIDVPAAVTAETAQVPPAVVPHVRWRGAPHAALAAWEADESYVFLEPAPTPTP